MRNKELVLRRIQTLDGRVSQMRQALNEVDLTKCREVLQAIVELKEDLKSIVEREN